MCHAGDHTVLFSALLAIKAKLVDGASAPFDMHVAQNQPRHGGGGAAGGIAGGIADGGGGGGPGGAVGDGHHHGHRHGDDDDENNPHGQNRRVVSLGLRGRAGWLRVTCMLLCWRKAVALWFSGCLCEMWVVPWLVRAL